MAASREEALLFSRFESIGDNCEFAFAQKIVGVDESSLLRWASVPSVDALLLVLQSELKGIFEFANIRPFIGGLVRDVKFGGVAFHSTLKTKRGNNHLEFVEDQDTRRAVHAQEKQKIDHLASITLQRLRSGSKIFVFKRNCGTLPREAREICQMIRKYHPGNTLLVVESSVTVPVGTVSAIADGVFYGYIDRFAPYEDSTNVSIAGWRVLLQEVERQYDAVRSRKSDDHSGFGASS